MKNGIEKGGSFAAYYKGNNRKYKESLNYKNIIVKQN